MLALYDVAQTVMQSGLVALTSIKIFTAWAFDSRHQCCYLNIEAVCVLYFVNLLISLLPHYQLSLLFWGHPARPLHQTHCLPPSSNPFQDIRSLLKLNSNKTEVIPIGSKSTLSKQQNLILTIYGLPVTLSSKVKRVGVTLDNTLSFKTQIKTITWSAFFHLCNIQWQF